MAKESMNVDPLDQHTEAKAGGANASRGSTHQQYVGNIAQYGNGDFVRQGVDTTDPGVIGGANIVGTTLEELSDDEPEGRGLRLNDAYKGLRGGQKQRPAADNKARATGEDK